MSPYGLPLPLLGLGLILAAQSVSAQGPGEATKLAVAAVTDPSLQSPVSDGKPTIVLSGSAAEKKAEAQIGIVHGSTQFALKLAAPLDDGATSTELATLDGLTNQATADIGITWVWWNPHIDPGVYDDLCNDVKAALSIVERLTLYEAPTFSNTSFRSREAFADSLATPVAGSAFAELDAFLKKELRVADLVGYLKKAATDSTEWAKVLAALNKGVATRDLFSKDARFPDSEAVFVVRRRLTSGSLSEKETRVLNRLLFEALYPPERLHRSPEDLAICAAQHLPPYSRLYALVQAQESRIPLFFGAHAKLGRREFKYFDEASLKTAKEQKDSSSFTITAGVLAQPTLYAGLNFTYQDTFKAGTTAQVCIPVGIGGIQECTNLQINAPTEKLQNIGQLELRKFFGTHFAVDGFASYDFKSATKGIDVKVLFLQDKDGGLTGGIDLGWRSDTKNLSAVAFVSEKLNLFPSF